jgi:mannose-P-dolichol utilization defect 1
MDRSYHRCILSLTLDTTASNYHRRSNSLSPHVIFSIDAAREDIIVSIVGPRLCRSILVYPSLICMITVGSLRAMQEQLNALLQKSPEELIRFLISTVLGYGVVFGSVILKVPQILKILRSGSADGVSLTANLIELTGYAISTSWAVAQKFEFKDFGENVFILAQLVVLIGLVSFHQRSLGFGIAGVVGILSAMYALCVGTVSTTVHQSLLSFQLVLLLSSRVPQIYMSYRNRSTGQLAFLTFFLAFGGGCARLLTVFLNVPWENGKGTLLVQFGSAVILNGIILSQIFLYGDKKGAKKTIPAVAAKKTDAAAKKK